MSSESEKREFWKSIGGTVVASLLVSVVGGSCGTYIAFRLLEQRVEMAESAIKTMRESDIKELRDADAALVSKIDHNKDLFEQSLRGVTIEVQGVRNDLANLRGYLEARLPVQR